MRGRPRKLYAFVMVMAVYCATPPLSAAIVSVPGITMVGPDESVSVPVSVEQVSDLYAFQFDLSFSGGSLMLIRASIGSFFSTDSLFYYGGAGASGITVAGTLTGPGPGYSGAGQLAVLDISARSQGTSQLVLSNVVLLNSQFEDIPVTTRTGEVVATPEPRTFPLMGAALMVYGFLRTRRGKCAACPRRGV